tara:strand:- start:468 stop:692 length:225 start_codon:yes stop_codon:yes gene_type:complete
MFGSNTRLKAPEYTVRGNAKHAVLFHNDEQVMDSPDIDFLDDLAGALNAQAACRRSSQLAQDSSVIVDSPIGAK